MDRSEIGRWEASEFAAKFGQRPDHELAFLSNVFCNLQADWRSIRTSIPETITVKAVLEGFPSQLYSERYHSVIGIAKEAYRAVLMPQVESLGLLASTGNELFMILSEIINLSEKTPPLVRYGLECMENMLQYYSSPGQWDKDGRLPCLTGHTYLNCNLFTLAEQAALLESARLVGKVINEGAVFRFARQLSKRSAISEGALQEYWDDLEVMYQRPNGCRNSREEAARIARLDVVLNAFCAAQVETIGAAEVFANYRKQHPATEKG